VPRSALALVILGALVHATWNVLAKRASGGAPFVWLYGLVSLLAASPVGVLAWQQQKQPLSLEAWAAIVCSAALHLLYSLTLQKGYQVSDFSIVYPVARGTGPLFAVLAAVALLAESPTHLGWLGIAAIVMGILLIADFPSGASMRHSQVQVGVGWGVLTGACIASYTVVDGWAIKGLQLDPVLYYVLGLLLRTTLLAPQVLRSTDHLAVQWARNARYIVAVGLLAPVAYTLILYALTQAPLVYVAPTREVSMLVGVVIGALLLKEPFTTWRLLGAASMVFGVAMLSMAR
jgi:drug/metabolite transporter (DMT)-like permease